MPEGHAGNGEWNDGQTFEDRVFRSVLSCDIEGQRTEGYLQKRSRPREIPFLSGHRGGEVRSPVSRLVPMSNHFHLMVQTPEGNLSRIMKHINNSYTNYFNIKRKRSGHLLQGRNKGGGENGGLDN